MGDRSLVSFDYAVKYLLREKADFVILSGFLTELLGRRVEVVSILESESNKVDADGKVNRVDLKAQIDGGEFAVFEIQFLQQFDFLGKVLFGVSKAVVEQVSSGGFYDIKKVHSINVSYYNLNAKREYLFQGKLGGFRGIHFEDESIPFAQATGPKSESIVDIHPEYYLILPEMFDENLRGKFDEWVYLLKHSDVRETFTAAGIQEAKIRLDMLKMSPEEKRTYERYMDNRSSADSVVLTAEHRGWQKRTVEFVKQMSQSGFCVADIVRATNLPEKEVNEILGL